MIRNALLLCLSILFFAAPLAAEELTGTLAQIQKSGEIRIGYRASEPPMSFVDADKKPAGYSIDVCTAITQAVEKKIGSDIKVKYVSVTAENRFKALTDNKIDILCGSTTKTLARSEIVDFTQLTFVTGAALMMPRQNDTRKEGFAGKKIGVIKGSTTVAALQEVLKETETQAEIVLFNTASAGVDALHKKKIDAFSADQIVLIGILLAEKDSGAFMLDRNVFSFEPFALAVRRNDADFRLVADREISSLHRSKEIVKIYEKWIGRHLGQPPLLFEALIKLNATPE
jgi:glutamate/aspartate transport system substrate-binding protein